MSCKSNTSLDLRQSFFPAQDQQQNGRNQKDQDERKYADRYRERKREGESDRDKSKESRNSLMRLTAENDSLIQMIPVRPPKRFPRNYLPDTRENRIKQE